MILLTGGDLVLPDRIVGGGSLLIDNGRIAALAEGSIDGPAGATRIDATGMLIAPGFVDVHVHGVEGHDVLDGPEALTEVAARLPRYGVTAFCPTSIACDPDTLARFLQGVQRARRELPVDSAVVLPAHLESNFISPEYKGAQPLECIRTPLPAAAEGAPALGFDGRDILATLETHADAVGIVTLAPEIAGGMDLVERVIHLGACVSIGHTGATYEQALAAIDAGACHATHLFNRMTPMSHRAPGVPGAVLQSEQVAAELVCDGFHVHPALMELAIRLKGPGGIMAITDGTAGSGLPVGSRTRLGGRPIVVTSRTAELEDGTIAGSVLTMDGALRTLVGRVGVSVVEAVRMCATTPAEQLKLVDKGRLSVGAIADIVLLDRALAVQQTYLAGRPWRNPSPAAVV